jgi:DNA mismatch repair ATPase MutS
VQTAGAERLLEQMFHHPLVEAEKINARSHLFRWFGDLDLLFPIGKEIFSKAERYLTAGTAGSYPAAVSGLLIKKFQQKFLRDTLYIEIHEGLVATIKLLNLCRSFIGQLAERSRRIDLYSEALQFLKTLLSDPRLQWVSTEQEPGELSLMRVAKYDYLFKHTLQDQMEKLLQHLFELDVYLCVGRVAKESGFVYAEALPQEANVMRTTALRHPSLIKGTANPLSLSDKHNMIFLTGANMAGKSTFMKSFGIAVYLAHMGFPVAAKDMQFSVMDGLYSSINVPDNLDMGYSHFYAEVLRVKKVAGEVAGGKKLVVLFDELFKGTNVKDAYDGTLLVTRAFAGYRQCFYVISTHIIEVGEALNSEADNIQFAYLPTVMDGPVPRYTYRLQEGITEDRQGMLIIENEGILNVLNEETDLNPSL